jgi:hypothetical protein
MIWTGSSIVDPDAAVVSQRPSQTTLPSCTGTPQSLTPCACAPLGWVLAPRQLLCWHSRRNCMPLCQPVIAAGIWEANVTRLGRRACRVAVLPKRETATSLYLHAPTHEKKASCLNHWHLQLSECKHSLIQPSACCSLMPDALLMCFQLPRLTIPEQGSPPPSWLNLHCSAQLAPWPHYVDVQGVSKLWHELVSLHPQPAELMRHPKG